MQLLSLAFYVDINIPFMLRYLGGQYTGDDRNVQFFLNNLSGNIPNELFRDIKCILTVGTPTHLSGVMSREIFYPTGVMVTIRTWKKTQKYLTRFSIKKTNTNTCLHYQYGLHSSSQIYICLRKDLFK